MYLYLLLFLWEARYYAAVATVMFLVINMVNIIVSSFGLLLLFLLAIVLEIIGGISSVCYCFIGTVISLALGPNKVAVSLQETSKLLVILPKLVLFKIQYDITQWVNWWTNAAIEFTYFIMDIVTKTVHYMIFLPSMVIETVQKKWKGRKKSGEYEVFVFDTYSKRLREDEQWKKVWEKVPEQMKDKRPLVWELQFRINTPWLCGKKFHAEKKFNASNKTKKCNDTNTIQTCSKDPGDEFDKEVKVLPSEDKYEADVQLAIMISLQDAGTKYDQHAKTRTHDYKILDLYHSNLRNTGNLVNKAYNMSMYVEKKPAKIAQSKDVITKQAAADLRHIGDSLDDPNEMDDDACVIDCIVERKSSIIVAFAVGVGCVLLYKKLKS